MALYNLIRQSIYVKNKFMSHLQDLYKYDSAVFGLNQLYMERADHSFKINYKPIISPNHILNTGQTLMLITHQNNATIDARMVRFVDCFNDNININLVLFDIMKRKSIVLQLNAHEPKANYNWVLLDVTFIRDELEKFIVMKYCHCN